MTPALAPEPVTIPESLLALEREAAAEMERRALAAREAEQREIAAACAAQAACRAALAADHPDLVPFINWDGPEWEAGMSGAELVVFIPDHYPIRLAMVASGGWHQVALYSQPDDYLDKNAAFWEVMLPFRNDDRAARPQRCQSLGMALLSARIHDADDALPDLDD